MINGYRAGALCAVLFSVLLIGASNDVANAQTAVSVCGTLSSSGNYFLTKNLSATGTCLVIGADNVAIDLKGHTISGSGSGDGITDAGFDRDNVILVNGKITDFNVGVNLSASGDAVISNLTSSNNTGDGILVDLCCDTFNSVTADHNGGDGIHLTSGDGNFMNVQASNNGGAGIDATQCCNTVIKSTASSNAAGGVNISSDDNFVIASKIQNNSGDGISSSECCNGVVTSSITGNTGAGIDFSGGDQMVTESTVSNNTADGIDLSSKWGIISDVVVQHNGGDGVNMLCVGSTALLDSVFNTSANLVQTVSNGPCANVNLFAP